MSTTTKRTLLTVALTLGLTAGLGAGGQAAFGFDEGTEPTTYNNSQSTINKCTGGDTNLFFDKNMAYDLDEHGKPIQIKPMFNYNYAPVIILHGFNAANGDQHIDNVDPEKRPAFSQLLGMNGNADAYAQPDYVGDNTNTGDLEAYTELDKSVTDNWNVLPDNSSHQETNRNRSLVGEIQQNRGFAVYSFDYSKVEQSLTGSKWVTDAEIGPKLHDAINCLYGATKNRIVLVAHSMGGLAARYAMSRDWQTASYVKDVFTFGTPNLGSVFTYSWGDTLSSWGSVFTGAFANACSETTGRQGYVTAESYARYKRCLVESPKAGPALLRNSPELQALPDWDDIRTAVRRNDPTANSGDLFKVHAFAGDTVNVLHVSFFGAVPRIVQAHAGDSVVGVKSALDQADDRLVAICKTITDIAVVGALKNVTPCTHGAITTEPHLAGYLNEQLAGTGGMYGVRGYYGPYPDLKFTNWRDAAGYPNVTGGRLGPIKVDMSVDDVSAYTGKTYTDEDTRGDQLVISGGITQTAGISLELVDNKVNEIRVTAVTHEEEADIADWLPWAKDKVTIGSTLTQVQAAYPGATAVKMYPTAETDNFQRVQIPDAGGYITFVLYKQRVIMFESGKRMNETDVPMSYAFTK